MKIPLGNLPFALYVVASEISNPLRRISRMVIAWLHVLRCLRSLLRAKERFVGEVSKILGK